MNPKPSLVILTGAGISAESGIKTFRAHDGLWENHRVEDVASPEGFRQNPELVQRFYNERRRQLSQVSPNAAHHALAELEHKWPGPFLLVTQNVDDLHDRAGNRSLLHMHGELMKARCMSCNVAIPWKTDVLPSSACPACNIKGKLRPHIVWFGEVPLGLDEISDALQNCNYFAAIGTSGHVYPAAGFVQWANQACHTTEINLEPSIVNSAFKESIHGPATITVPIWAKNMLSMLKP
ncbi:MAG: NAD-dependent protein deacylase [Holophagaceae bacterium]|nr:NAD-dependent protein deacylase [Holophagaceae bacterium]